MSEKNRKTWPRLSVTCLLLLGFIFFGVSNIQAEVISLVEDTLQSQASTEFSRQRRNAHFQSAARWRPINLSSRVARVGGIAAGDDLALNLFPDAAFQARVDRVSVDVQGTVSIRGRIKDYPLGHVLITTTGGLSLVKISVPEMGGAYLILNEPSSGAHYLLDLDPSRLDELESSPAVIPPPAAFTEEYEINVLQEKIMLNQAVEDPPAVIDVLVVYTPAAKQWADGYRGRHQQCDWPGDGQSPVGRR